MKFLAVDDFATMRRIIKTTLEGLRILGSSQPGSTFAEASDYGEAVNACYGQSFDLIICDGTLGERTGLEFLTHVRANATRANTPFILVLSKSTPADVAAVKAAGNAAILIKPFTSDTMKAKIEAVCGVVI